jgi:hypothetical protein
MPLFRITSTRGTTASNSALWRPYDHVPLPFVPLQCSFISSRQPHSTSLSRSSSLSSSFLPLCTRRSLMRAFSFSSLRWRSAAVLQPRKSRGTETVGQGRAQAGKRRHDRDAATSSASANVLLHRQRSSSRCKRATPVFSANSPTSRDGLAENNLCKPIVWHGFFQLWQHNRYHSATCAVASDLALARFRADQ